MKPPGQGSLYPLDPAWDGGWGGLSKQRCPPPSPLRPAQTGGDAEKAMASLVQYSKVKGTVGGSQACRPARWPCPTSPRPTAQPLWLQAPIQESLISFSDEDTNRQAVESFRGEWPQPLGSLCLRPRSPVALSLPSQGGARVAPVPRGPPHFYSCSRGCGLYGVCAGRQWWARLTMRSV